MTMVRLSKKAREQLKADGMWFGDASTRPIPAGWKAGAEAFEALAMAANPYVEPLVQPQATQGGGAGVLKFFPRMSSYQQGFFNTAGLFSDQEVSSCYPVDTSNITACPSVLAKAYFTALAVKAVETSGIGEASESFQIPIVPLPFKVCVALESVGSFNFGQYRIQFADVPSFVKSCLRVVILLDEGSPLKEAVRSFQAPTSPQDKNFKRDLANRLVDWCRINGVTSPTEDEMARTFFSGYTPVEFMQLSIRSRDDVWPMIRTLFWEYTDSPSFQKHVLRGETGQLLVRLGFDIPDVDLMFRMTTRQMCLRAHRAASQIPLGVGLRGVTEWSTCDGSPLQLVNPLKDGITYVIPTGIQELPPVEMAVLSNMFQCYGTVPSLSSVDGNFQFSCWPDGLPPMSVSDVASTHLPRPPSLGG